MSSWPSTVSEIQRVLQIPPGKFKVKKLDDGEVLQLPVSRDFVLRASDTSRLAAVATPTNRTPVGVCIDFSDSIVGIMYGNAELRVFKNKDKCVNVNMESGIDIDEVARFIEMSNVHPVLADIDAEDCGDHVALKSSGPLLYHVKMQDFGKPMLFNFQEKACVLTMPARKTKRRRITRT